MTCSLHTPLFALALAAAVGAAGCSDSKRRIEERQKALEEARAAQEKKDTLPGSGAAAANRPAHPFWDDPSLVVVRPDGKCPDGLWALFPGPAPGGDDQTRRANEGRRAELASALRARTYVAKLRGPPEVLLKDYDAPKGLFPLELMGTLDCEDSAGRIAIAFTEPRAITPKGSAVSGDAIVQSIWEAPPLRHEVPLRTSAEAKPFQERHRFGMEGYVVFGLGATDVHHKKIKVPKESGGGITIGGTVDDFGAGRMVRAEVKGVRVIANPGPVVAVDTREPSAVTVR